MFVATSLPLLAVLVLQGDQDIQVRKDVEPNVISVIADRILRR